MADTLSRPAVAGATFAKVAAKAAVISPTSSPQAGLAFSATAARLHPQPRGPLATQNVGVMAPRLQLPSSSAGQLPGGLAESSTAKQGGNAAGSLPFDFADIAKPQLTCQ
jgi:hypothetical protein